MGEVSLPITGGCLCGAVRYEASEPPFWVGHCHCQNCRKHTGVAFATDAMFRAAKLTWLSQEPTYYKSSEILERGFCPTCGSTVSARYFEEPDIVVMAAGSLDDPNVIEPTLHPFTSRRVKWLRLSDGLQEYPEAEPESGIEV